MNTRKKRGFYNFSLFDGISSELQTDKIIRVVDDRIAGIEDSPAREKYPEYEWIDLKGFTLLPGLIDAHIHITVKVNFSALRQMNDQLKKNFYN